MIHISMHGLIGSHNKRHVSNCRIGVQIPVSLCNQWRWPIRDHSRINVREHLGVRAAGLLFQIAHKSMRGLGRCHIQHEKRIEENALCSDDEKTLEQCRSADLDPRQQMHALILGLFEQFHDPAVVSLHSTQRSQMSNHTSDHAWHGCNSLEHNGPVQIALAEKHIGKESQKTHHSQCNAIALALRIQVRRVVDVVELLQQFWSVHKSGILIGGLDRVLERVMVGRTRDVDLLWIDGL